MSLNKIEDFQEKVEVYKSIFPDAIVLAAYLSLGGFTDEASDFCLRHGIAVAEIRYEVSDTQSRSEAE